MSTLRHEQFIDQLRAVLPPDGSVEPASTLAMIASFARRATSSDAAGFALLTAARRL